MDRVSVCPSREDLRYFLLGDVAEHEIEETEQHLTQCPRCLEIVQRLDAVDPLVVALQAQAQTPNPVTDEQIEEMIRRLQALRGEAMSPDVDLADAQVYPPGSDAWTEGESFPESSVENFSFLPPPQQPGEIGRLSVYSLQGVLGSGGMGIVFRAEDLRLGRLVALKVLRPGLIDSASARQRFLREARAAAAVEHEYVVHINDVGEDQRIPYVAMPLLQGETLDARIRREGRLANAEVLRIGREVAEGLAAAHARGLVHRDIKPANIWLEGENGRVKLLDFGLARPAEDGGEVTRTGFVVGTPAFMAPEQAQGGTINARTDLFSLGCVLYRIATGRLPFEGATSLQVLHVLISQEPTPPRQLNPQIPAALEQLIVRLLAKDPAGRPASAREVAETLIIIEAGEPAPPTPPGSTERPRKAQGPLVRNLTLAMLLVALLALGLWCAPFLLRIGSNCGQLKIETDRDVLVVLHKDGQRMRILHAEQTRAFDVPAGEYRVDVMEAPAGTLLSSHDFQLPRGGCAVLTASPPGNASQPIPAKIPGLRKTLSGVGKPARGVAFSPDGRLLAAAGNGKVMVWELATGKVSVVLEMERDNYSRVVFSPDSKQLACSGLFSFVRVWNLADGQAITTKQLAGETKSLAWSPDSKRLLSGTVRWYMGGATDTRGDVLAWDPDSGETQKVYSSETEQVPTNVAYSPDGQLVAASMFRWNPAKSTSTLLDLRVWDARSGSRVHTLRGSRLQAAGLAFSPDGKQLARGAAEGTVERWEVATGQTLPSLSNGAKQSVLCLTFSPDSCRLASTGSDAAITIWDLATRKPHLVLRGQQSGFHDIAYSPDGRLLASASEDGSVQLWDATHAPEGGTP